jgi:hypothetical protein
VQPRALQFERDPAATGIVRLSWGVWHLVGARFGRNTGSVADWVNDKDDARWAAFPVRTAPRPIVLLDERVRIEGGFNDSNSKEAWLGGRIGWSTPLPPAVSALLPARGRAHTDRELTITEVVATTAEFRCDRGPRELPAYRLKVTGMYGSCVILSPAVECWWPRLPEDERRRPGGLAKIDDDGVTIRFPAFGGVLTEFHRAEFQEHANYVVGHAITSKRPVPAGTRVHLIAISRRVTGRLANPLGARVLLDTAGQPLSVTANGEDE